MTGLTWAAGFAALMAAGCSSNPSAEPAASNKAAAIVTDDKAAFAAGGGSDGLTLEEYGKVSRAMRDALDADSNGQLSAAELEVLPEQRRNAWKMRDADRDGTITSAEYDSSWTSGFTVRDKNHDGKIMPDEIPDGTPAGGLLF